MKFRMNRALQRNLPKIIISVSIGLLVFFIIPRSSKNPEFMRQAENINSERIAKVNQVCEKYFPRGENIRKNEADETSFKQPPAPQYAIFYMDKKHNISYCPIYKSGSTTWIYNMCLLNGVKEEELMSGREQISTIARRIMPELEYPEADEMLRETAKMIIVRHPFERLLSAYRDKLENSVAGREHGSLHFYQKYGKMIVRKFRDKNRPLPNSNQVIQRPGHPSPAGIEPTWREFVEYLISTDLASYADDHWMPYNLYCTPCLVQYDIIAKVESLDQDQKYAIEKLGLTGRIKPRWRHSTTDGLKLNAAKVYFSQLQPRHVKALFEKYYLDFMMFGYSATDYYDLATATT